MLDPSTKHFTVPMHQQQREDPRTMNLETMASPHDSFGSVTVEAPAAQPDYDSCTKVLEPYGYRKVAE